MQIAFALFDRFTALDAVGPFQVLAELPGTEIVFVAEQAGAVLDRHRRAGDGRRPPTFDEITAPDVIVVPGGLADATPRRTTRSCGWIREVHATTTWTTSVCTGSLLLGAAGLLDGVDATIHWAPTTLGELRRAADPERVVRRGKIVTAAGVSSGIDMA